MSFEYYLKRKKLAPSSIESYQGQVQSFVRWIESQGLEKEDLRYLEILQYIDHCRDKGNSQRTIKHQIRIIKYWLDYHFKYLRPNPCHGIHIKDHGRLLSSPLLNEVQINELYRSYPQSTIMDIRNKVILGLMCYQALHSGQIINLLMEDVKMEYQAIVIRKTIKSNARSLPISDQQKPVLAKYVEGTRAAILKKNSSARLIVRPGPNQQLRNTLQYFVKLLKKRYPIYKNPHQLRASVISNWLKHFNLREVQKMVGHKYVSSTERYLVSHVDELQKSLDQKHPWQ